MIHWLFDLTTGLFTGRSMDASEDFLEANRPDGFAWAEGVADSQSQRVDLDVLKQIADLELHLDQGGEGEVISETIALLRARLIVDYQPPPPSDDHEWAPERKRYRLKPEAAQAQRRRATAIERIAELERQSLRPLRELRVAEVEGRSRPDAAAAKLKQIDSEIEALRPDLGGAQR